MRVLVDADALAYASGFAAQRVHYDWAALDANGDIVEEGIATTRDELDAIRAMAPDGVSIEASSIIEAEPLVNALAMTKRTLLSMETAMDEAGVDFDRLELFLTGKGNFRDGIATIKGYKANRIGIERPVHYKAIRRYMRERWNATVVNGCEADDMLATIAYSLHNDPEKVCIISMDKDLKTVPGRLYNFRRKQMTIISPEEAAVNFYRQLLTGDTVDNIGGCFRCGEKRASELINLGMTAIAMYSACLEEYRASLARKGCPYVDMGAEAALLENAQLLHLQRWPGDLWYPPRTIALDTSAPSENVSALEELTSNTNRTSTGFSSPSRFQLEGIALPVVRGVLSVEAPTSPTSKSAKVRTSKRKGA